MAPRLRAILFDLDGTLLDTAPDMVGALNALRREEDLEPLAYETVRPTVSHGSARVVKMGFPDAAPEHFAGLQRRFLEIYRGALSRGTRLFPGMDGVLVELEGRRLKSGIVTNKPAWLTEPLLQELGLRGRFACVVSGDTLAQRKPDPAPLLHAADLAGVSPDECVYVGDAERDVQAARGAGMPALVASYGYVGEDDDEAAWGGDAYLQRAEDLLAWLDASGRA
ncbi:MAG TPA: phosphoglycolate phosphatase [Steroidobacteraceae bacterium]|jgi:phosphoglycolate phosphatase|nr:phosphoglycolate phosphatase [Steroidobacteraceae bacterium]